MDIKLTTDWVLTNLPHTMYCDGNGVALLVCDGENYHWVKLAFETLSIEYTDEEYFFDNDDDDDYEGDLDADDQKFDNGEYVDNYIEPEYHFLFKLDNIKDLSPLLYMKLLSFDTANRLRKTIGKNDNYVHTNGKLFTFQECEKFLNVISHDNLGTLANHICVPELAVKIEGFVEQDGVLYLNVGNEFISVQKNIETK